MAVTPNMGLQINVAGITPGPTYATNWDTNTTTLDNHDHTSGKGLAIRSAAIDIDADLSFNGFNILSVGTLNITTITATNLGGDLNLNSHNLTNGGTAAFTTMTATTVTTSNLSGCTVTGPLALGSQTLTTTGLITAGSLTVNGSSAFGLNNLSGTHWNISGAAGNASFSGTLGVTGLISANGGITATGTVTLGTSVAGFTMTGNLALGSNNLSMTGSITGPVTAITATTITATNAAITNLTAATTSYGANAFTGTGGLTCGSLTVTNAATVGTTLNVTGLTTVSSITISGALSTSTGSAARAVVIRTGGGTLTQWLTNWQQFSGLNFGTVAANGCGIVAGLTLTGAAVGDTLLCTLVSTSTSNLLTTASSNVNGFICSGQVTATNTIEISIFTGQGAVLTSCTIDVTLLPK